MRPLINCAGKATTREYVLRYLFLVMGILFWVSVSPPQANGADEFTINQTLSDEAQLNTIAFDGLAFITGDHCADSFLPPGKIADFFGFQYLRDNDADRMGHNTDFLTRIANNVLYVLNDRQVSVLTALAQRQVHLINAYAYRRFPLMDALRRQLEGDLPAGSEGLDKNAVMAYSANLYRLDGLISIQRAVALGAILRSLNSDQVAYLDQLADTGMLSWPILEDQVDPQSLDHDEHVAVMTYASQLFSWHAGSPDADTYFCPERQGTYFGSFYLKDMPAMGHENFNITENLTAEMGTDFLAALNAPQAELITSLVDIQRKTLQEIVDTRYGISLELRDAMAGASIDRASVMNLAGRYGERDGEIVFNYAMIFSTIAKSLSIEQTEILSAIRERWNTIACQGAYLYSEPIDMPGIRDTDFLFGLSRATYSIVDTGQAICYDNSAEMSCPGSLERFSGQDAQYLGNQPGYADNGDGTVTDLNTGLMWQQDPGEKMTCDEALSGEASFHLAGHTDWRLPTIKELYSLIQFSGIDPSGMDGNDTAGLVPFIDTGYFRFEYGDTTAGERIIDAQYLSSTRYVSVTMNGEETAFGVNFADGRIKGYGTGAMPGQREGKTFFVLHVRGNTNYGINDYVDNGDGTITDQSTGLMWMQVDSGHLGAGGDGDGALSWEQALDWAENLTHAGFSDWRLPNAKELQSIVDYTRSPATTDSPAIDPIFLTSGIIDEGAGGNYPFFWTSTTHANSQNGMNAVYIAFGEALGWMQTPYGAYELMDVHGAGAQRSDPKIGDPSDYPYGHGPQGDVLRIENYGRCVRDVKK